MAAAAGAGAPPEGGQEAAPAQALPAPAGLNNDALWAAVHLRIEDKSSFTALYRAVREADLWARLQLGAAGEGHIPQAARGQLRGALFARLADVNELPGGVILGDCVHTFAAVLRLLELEAEHLTGLLRRADPPVTIGDRAAAAPRQTVPAQTGEAPAQVPGPEERRCVAERPR